MIGLLMDIVGKMLVGCDRLPRRNPVVYKQKFSILQQDGQPAAVKRFAYTDCDNTIISVI